MSGMQLFKRLDPVVQSLVGWVTLGGLVLSAFYSLVGLLSPVFAGRHWTEVVLLSIAMSLSTLIALALLAAIIAWTIRKIKPLPAGANGQALFEELEQTKERLRRAEARLDDAVYLTGAGTKKESKPPAQTIHVPLVDNTNSGKRKLTETDRERCAQALRDVHDFIGGRVRPFLSVLALEYGKNSPQGFIELLPQIQAEQRALAGEAGELWHKHANYLGMMGLDTLPMNSSLESMRNPIKAATEASGWPQAAQKERTKAVVAAYQQVRNAANEIWDALPNKREEYING